MRIEIKAVDDSNKEEALQLSVAKDQVTYIESVKES